MTLVLCTEVPLKHCQSWSRASKKHLEECWGAVILSALISVFPLVPSAGSNTLLEAMSGD